MADITVTAANVAYSSGPTSDGTAGETITAGECVYLKSSDSRYWKSQSDGTAAEAAAVGIALHASLAGQPLKIAATGSTINIGGTTAVKTYFVGAAAGGIAPEADVLGASGSYLTRLGYATGTSGAVFKVDIAASGATVA